LCRSASPAPYERSAEPYPVVGVVGSVLVERRLSLPDEDGSPGSVAKLLVDGAVSQRTSPAGRHTSTHSSGRRSRAGSRLLAIADLRSASTWTPSHTVTVNQQVRGSATDTPGSKRWAGGVQVAALGCSWPIHHRWTLVPGDRMTRPDR